MMTLDELRNVVSSTKKEYVCFSVYARFEDKREKIYIFCKTNKLRKELRSHPSNISFEKVVKNSIVKIFAKTNKSKVYLNRIPLFSSKEEQEFYCDDLFEFDMYFELNNYTPIKYER